MKVKTKFYGYRAGKTAEDKRISRLKKPVDAKIIASYFSLRYKNWKNFFCPNRSQIGTIQKGANNG